MGDMPIYVGYHSADVWTNRKHFLLNRQDLYEEFRIDHFRGFAGYWAVPSEAKVALVGRWRVGPRNSLFDAIFKTSGKIKIIAEDLGVITKDVVQLRKHIGAPGMAAILSNGGDSSSHTIQLSQN